MARLVTMMTNANPTTAAVEDAGSVAGQETVLRDKLAGICAFGIFEVIWNHFIFNINSYYTERGSALQQDRDV